MFKHEAISNICTVAIVPVTSDVIPAHSHLAHHLTSALNTIGTFNLTKMIYNIYLYLFIYVV